MNKETVGVVISVKKQWWLKVNTKPIRTHALDGATFPHVIKVQYEIEGKPYTKRQWIHAGCPVASVGDCVKVVYCVEKPNKAKIL